MCIRDSSEGSVGGFGATTGGTGISASAACEVWAGPTGGGGTVGVMNAGPQTWQPLIV